MKSIAAAVALTFATLAAGSALAAEEKKPTPQQERMKSCNKDAGEQALKGDARKKFMSSCLKGETGAADTKATPQQEKMKACNKEAGDKALKGDERKKFMSGCLKG